MSFFHVLKYWAWGDQEIIEVVEAVRDGEMPLEGMLDEGAGLARWLFDARALKLWRLRRTPDSVNWFSVPHVAKLLGLKQGIAYWMVRTRHHPSRELSVATGEGSEVQGRGTGKRVNRAELGRFRKSYVFATEIAAALDTSSRKVSGLLKTVGVHPVSGEGTEKSGKVFYSRTDELIKFIATLHVVLPV